MKYRFRSFPMFLIVLSFITVGYLSGVSAVPFHPDESSYIFMSSDLEIFFQSPGVLSWHPESIGDTRQQYRLLNPPLVHVLTGLGRLAAGLPALPVDWDWTKTWQENRQNGALPSENLLLAGRMAEAVLFPFSILFLFLTVRRVTNNFTAWVAALLLASNALVLLHTRRAMAEGGLLFTLTLTMWSLVTSEKRPWLTAIPTALAFCAKQTLAALGPAGLFAALWPVDGSVITPGKQKALRLFKQIVLFGITFGAIVFLLNPFLWSQPFPAALAAFRARQALANTQTADRPDQALNTLDRKLIGLIGSVYMTPPIFAETSNYLAETAASEQAYLANPLQNLFRSLPAGSILLVIGLFGFILGGLRAFRSGHPARRGFFLLWVATLLQTMTLLALVPLPWQRYYLPVVPYACLWTAVGAEQLLKPLASKILGSPHRLPGAAESQ